MAQREFTRNQGIAVVAAVVLSVSLMLWGAKQLLGRPGAMAQPVEVAPVVAEEVSAGERVEAPSASPAQMTDDLARRREALENLKYGVRTSEVTR